MRLVPAVAAILLAVPALAQQGNTVRIDDHAINAGGHPADGVVMASASYRITLDSLGDPMAGLTLESGGYRMQGSFGSCYAPPGEVTGLRFDDAVTLVWAGEPSVGSYNLYRGGIGNLALGGYGSCVQPGLPDESAVDSEPPPVNDGFFYLVTAENRLEEEGTKGTNSADGERGTPDPCP